jgi:hypothetical protein
LNLCLNCGGMFPKVRKGRCNPCYLYLRRHGVERPDYLISTKARKVWERRERLDMLRTLACCDTIYIVTTDYAGPSLCELPPGHLSYLHRGWAGEWTWDRGNLILYRSDELVGQGA